MSIYIIYLLQKSRWLSIWDQSWRSRGDEIFIYIYIFFSSLWYRGKARRWVPPLHTQSLQNLAESRERSVLTLGLLCLPRCVRDTAWSWFNLICYLGHFLFILIFCIGVILKFFYIHASLIITYDIRHSLFHFAIKRKLLQIRFMI